MTWSPGAARIRELLEAGELERVEPSLVVARRLLDDADQHLASARTITGSGDLAGAYQLSYDALRKSAAALLSVQGIRATSRGGHIAVQDTVVAQFNSTVPVFSAFGRIRRNRNRFEYPGDVASEPTSDDIDDALTVAREAASRVRIILDQGILDAWRE